MTHTHTTSTARLQTRLERLELEHLRAVCAEMGQELELLRQENAYLADVADRWREDHQALSENLQNNTADARSIGLTRSGEQIIIREWVGAQPIAHAFTASLLAALERAHLWMAGQADWQSKGGFSAIDLKMLRKERDAIAEAIAQAVQP
jgi:hypothetical protein